MSYDCSNVIKTLNFFKRVTRMKNVSCINALLGLVDYSLLYTNPQQTDAL